MKIMKKLCKKYIELCNNVATLESMHYLLEAKKLSK